MKLILFLFFIFLFSCVFALPIDYASGTEVNNAQVSKSDIYVYVEVPGTNESNITFALYNSSGQIQINTYEDFTRFVKWSDLSPGNYSYNVSVSYNGTLNSTSTRRITLFPAELSMELETNSISVGDVFFVDLMIDNALDLFSFEFDLIYDHLSLEPINPIIEEGTFLNSSNDTLCLGGSHSQGSIDNYACILYILSGNRVGVNGSGVLARAFFRAIDEGNTYINFSQVILQDSSSPTKNIMMYSATDSMFSIQGDVDVPRQISPRDNYFYYNESLVDFHCISPNANNLTLWSNVSGFWSEIFFENGTDLNYGVVVNDTGIYSWACVARDYNEIVWSSSNYSFNVIDKTIPSNITMGDSWENGTTELDKLSNDDLFNISNVNFINFYGKIRFLKNLRIIGNLNLLDKIIIENRRIFVDSNSVSEFNQSAELSFFNLTLNNPLILKDGISCSNPLCNITSYIGGELIFVVAGFSEYTVVESPTCDDGIQNQDETGVDCGGSCPSCSSSRSSSGSSGSSGSSSSSSSGGGSFSSPSVSDLGMTGEVIEHSDTCIEKFVCGGWGPCVNGTKLRQCSDSNNCSKNLMEESDCFEEKISYLWNYVAFFVLSFFVILILHSKFKSPF